MEAESELDKLSISLFRTFARFEFALKASGYISGGGHVTADWQRFAADNPNYFDQTRSPALEAALQYFETQPPKKQVLVDGGLAWRMAPAGGASRTDDILILVRRVRNNLFHGGKFNGHWFDPGRSEELLRHSLAILHDMIEHQPHIKAAHGAQVEYSR